MKTPVTLCLAAGLLLAGCGKKESSAPEKEPAPGAGNPVTAPVDYLGAVAKGKTRAEATIDTAALNQAVQMFQVEEGRLPNDLNELVAKKYLPRLPEAPYGMKIVYDPKSGQVKVVKQ